MDKALKTKVQEMIDRQEIWDVMQRYSRGMDRFDRDLVRSCYHDDAIDDHDAFSGTPDEFLDWAYDFHRNFQSVHHHCVTNHTCEVDGDDAHAETYYLFVGANNEPPHLLSIGRYIDHLQRRGGVWRIKSRVCVVERNFSLTENEGPVAAEDPALGPALPATRSREDVSYMRPVVPRRRRTV